MSSKQPFARRIVIAFVLLTVLVSGAFSLSIVAVVHFIEQRLVSEEMHRELNGVLHEDLKNGRAPLKGCYSEKTGKTYDAVVLLEDDGQRAGYKMVFDNG